MVFRVESNVPRFVVETRVVESVEEVWDFHSSVEALKILTEPRRRVVILSTDLRVDENALHEVQIRKFGFPLTMKVRITEVHPPNHFRDTQEQGFFRCWTHSHEFTTIPGGTLIKDVVDYQCPGGWIAGLINRFFVAPEIQRMWTYRKAQTHERLGELFE